jgi:hypothetical protein
MFGGWARTTLILSLLALATAASARAEGPGPKFKRLTDDPNDTMTSPDHQIRIEQYSRDLGDEGYAYQFWTFDRDHHHAFLLNKGEKRTLRLIRPVFDLPRIASGSCACRNWAPVT